MQCYIMRPIGHFISHFFKFQQCSTVVTYAVILKIVSMFIMVMELNVEGKHKLHEKLNLSTIQEPKEKVVEVPRLEY